MIVAFVQLGLFRGCNYNHAVEAYEDPELWRKYILKSKSGQRLQKAFINHYDKILWRQPNPDRPDPEAKSDLDYDIVHVRRTIQQHSPDIVIALGASAEKAVNEAVVAIPHNMNLIYGPHPSPKLGGEGMMKLVMAASEIKSYE